MKTRKPLWILFFGAFVLHSFVSGQDKARYVREAKQFPGQPIEIVSKSVGNSSLSAEGEVIAGPHWIKDFTLEIQNISKKNITGAHIHFEVAKTGAMPLPIVMPIYYKADQDNSPTVKGKKFLAPGERTSVGVAYYEQLLTALRNWGAEEVTNAKLSVRSIDFDDDTRWNAGFENRRDPLDPSKWIRTSSYP